MESFVQGLIEQFGVFGIALLMFLENIFPPIPSELIMPLAGYRSAQGDISIFLVIAAGSVGSLLGILPWYVAGRKLGERRLKRLARDHGRWLTMTPDDVHRANLWFKHRGPPAVLFGRLVPTVRTLISVPAGLARMPFGQFLAYSAIGTVAWTSALAFAGFLLGQAYETVEAYVGPVSNAIVILAVGYYIYRVVTFDANHGQKPETD
ncbi:DedA family protein [Pararhizobium haloflavum]|uniref:DedA family protein n=1 Tax=Pararhizobium haloflavum TaxID=2037914 RepID=UPI000C17BFCC|nr:DedA family protein [Pararhizobium haloflavum]